MIGQMVALSGSSAEALRSSGMALFLAPTREDAIPGIQPLD